MYSFCQAVDEINKKYYKIRTWLHPASGFAPGDDMILIGCSENR